MFTVSDVSLEDIPSLERELRNAGVVVDAEFGWVPLDESQHVFMARGTGPSETLIELNKRDRWVVYPDAAIG